MNKPTLSIKGLRIGIPQVRSIQPQYDVVSLTHMLFQEYFPSELSSSITQPIRKILYALKSKGASLIPVSLPSTAYALSAYYVIASAEASSNLARYDGIQYGKFALLYIPPFLETTLTKNPRASREFSTWVRSYQDHKRLFPNTICWIWTRSSKKNIIRDLCTDSRVSHLQIPFIR